jgi:hypothetical protein
MGAGNDSVTVRNNVIVTAGILMGSGYDALIFRNNVLYGHVDMLGDSESDALYLSGNLLIPLLGSYAYYYFELIQP